MKKIKVKNRFDFTVRITNYTEDQKSCLYDIRELVISDIAILIKREKYRHPEKALVNEKQYGYRTFFDFKKTRKGGGSHQYPCITFVGKYLYIHVKNFPRFPTIAAYTHMRSLDPKYWHTPLHYHAGDRIEIIHFKIV